jgi:hypothetical protein
MRRHPKRTSVDPDSPRAWATDDQSGFITNHDELRWQYDWAGTQLVNKRLLVHPDFLDLPQRQLGSLVLPPDPVPIMNARPENYPIDEEQDVRVTMDGSVRVLMGTVNPRLRITMGD